MEGRWTQHAPQRARSNIFITRGNGHDAYGPIDFLHRGDLSATGVLPITQLAIEPGLVWRELEREPRGTCTMPAAVAHKKNRPLARQRTHRWRVLGLWPTGGAWLYTHLCDRWDYGQDNLSRVDLPAIALRLEFFVDVLQGDPSTGHMITNPSIFLETSTTRAC
jgi:hypothetical protein